MSGERNAASYLEELYNRAPFSMARGEKLAFYTEALSCLTRHHASRCPEYARILGALGTDISRELAPQDQPMLPVRLFKQFELRSVDKADVLKTMTSSGTSGQAVSRIYLDRDTATAQSKVLSKIVSDFTGKQRLPMLVIDTKSVLKDRALFSARGAGILGFSMLGRDITYALGDDMEPDMDAIESFCDKYAGGDVLMFGFTFMIWRYFCEALKERGIKLPLRGTLIHGGGWKKLADSAVGAEAFRDGVRAVTGADRVLNYYGMVEQTGSIFMECERGNMHCSNYSDVFIRRFGDLSPAGPGERGFMELVSILPASYPGHALLSEDEGEIVGEDDCPCGRLGKYFKIIGRVKGAELRGCSDTYERK